MPVNRESLLAFTLVMSGGANRKPLIPASRWSASCHYFPETQ